MTTPTLNAEPGAAVYTPRMLRLYDALVLGFSNHYVWRCPTKRLVALYDECVSGNHLDVGIGTGYFLDKCKFPVMAPRVGLIDLNPATLVHAAKRNQRRAPMTFQRNVLEPIELNVHPFDSLGVNYLLHCLPGTMPQKAVAFDHLKKHLRPNATVFGSTLLHPEGQQHWSSRKLMAFYNQKGVFSNEGDTVETLERALWGRFDGVEIERVGCVAIFKARMPN